MIHMHIDLHPREREVLGGMSTGMTNAEIGKALHLGRNTIKSYQLRLFRTLGARNRTHAVSLGYLYGLLPDIAWQVRPAATNEEAA